MKNSICFLLFYIIGFSGSMQAQSSQDAINYGKSIRSQIKSQVAKQNSSGSEIWDEIHRIIKTTIQELNKQYQGRLSGSQSVYVLDTEWERVKAVFPDRNTCESGKILISNKLDQYQKKRKFGIGTENRSFTAGQGFAESCQCKQQTNTSYDSNSSSHTNQANDLAADLHSFDNFDIPMKDNTSQIQGSIFAVAGARERKQEQPAKSPEWNFSDIGDFINEKPVEKEKTINDGDIEEIIESCINSSNFCECVQSKFTQLTGKSLSGKYSQIRSEADIETNHIFNEYLGKIRNALDVHAEIKKQKLEEDAWSDKAFVMAEMSNYVYGRGFLPKNWVSATALPDKIQKSLDFFNSDDNGKDGFHAEIYQNEKTGEYVLSFRGTELDDNPDLVTDVSQAIGSNVFTSQYYKARSLIAIMQENCENRSISITGHSLGGGLASIAGYATGLPTYTFNAAGVHENTIKNIKIDSPQANTNNITAYHSNADVLSLVQDNTFLPVALGNRKNPKV